MPGDDLLPRAQFNPTRAITIDAPPAAVWPWLVQVGFGRAGFYSNDLLDNFARPSLREIDPDLQKLEAGQWPVSPFTVPVPADIARALLRPHDGLASPSGTGTSSWPGEGW